MTSLDTVQTFLKHVFSGTLEEALALVAPDAQFISARPVPNPRVPVHGTFVGTAGAREFFRLFLSPGNSTSPPVSRKANTLLCTAIFATAVVKQAATSPATGR